jgi:hypothetical protein
MEINNVSIKNDHYLSLYYKNKSIIPRRVFFTIKIKFGCILHFSLMCSYFTSLDICGILFWNNNNKNISRKEYE